MAFAPGFLPALDELPVVEARAEAARDGLWVLGSFVFSKAVISEAQRFREHPTFAAVLVDEGFNSLFLDAIRSSNLRFEIVEGDKCKYGVPKFRISVFVNSPEALCRETFSVATTWMVAFRKHMPQIRQGEVHNDG